MGEMIPLRTQVKEFVGSPESVDLAGFMGLFQRWVQQKVFEGQLIDVADCGHVVEGPGIVLIGHESDFAVESERGRLGLFYTRKRETDANLQSQLRTSFGFALRACQLIETDTAYKGKIKFSTGEVEIRLPDRLRFPNRPEVFEAVKGDIQAVLGDVYGSVPVNLTLLSDDPRHVFTVMAQAESTASIEELLKQLQPSLSV